MIISFDSFQVETCPASSCVNWTDIFHPRANLPISPFVFAFVAFCVASRLLCTQLVESCVSDPLIKRTGQARESFVYPVLLVNYDHRPTSNKSLRHVFYPRKDVLLRRERSKSSKTWINPFVTALSLATVPPWNGQCNRRIRDNCKRQFTG